MSVISVSLSLGELPSSLQPVARQALSLRISATLLVPDGERFRVPRDPFDPEFWEKVSRRRWEANFIFSDAKENSLNV